MADGFGMKISFMVVVVQTAGLNEWTIEEGGGQGVMVLRESGSASSGLARALSRDFQSPNTIFLTPHHCHTLFPLLP